MIKAICFDLDGVYFTSTGFKSFKRELVETYSCNSSSVEYLFHKSEEIENFKKGRLISKDFWDYVRDELDISLTDDEFRDLLVKGYSENSEVKEYIAKIKEKGIKACVCSNNFSSRIHALDNKFKFRKNFDVEVYSYKIGALKPDKKIYEILVEKCNLMPSEIVFSDDDEYKLVGAIELGINTFVYTTFDDFKLKLESLGVTI